MIRERRAQPLRDQLFREICPAKNPPGTGVLLSVKRSRSRGRRGEEGLESFRITRYSKRNLPAQGNPLSRRIHGEKCSPAFPPINAATSLASAVRELPDRIRRLENIRRRGSRFSLGFGNDSSLMMSTRVSFFLDAVLSFRRGRVGEYCMRSRFGVWNV